MFKKNNKQEILDVKKISNQLFVSIVKYGSIVEKLYNKKLKDKYSLLYNQFLELQKQIKNQVEIDKK